MLHKIDSKFFYPSINQSINQFLFFHLLQLQINNGGGIHCTLYGMVSRSTEKKMEPKKKKLFPSYNNPILAIYFYFYSKKKWHYPWIKKVKCYKLHLLLLLVLYPSFFFFFISPLFYFHSLFPLFFFFHPRDILREL